MSEKRKAYERWENGFDCVAEGAEQAFYAGYEAARRTYEDWIDKAGLQTPNSLHREIIVTCRVPGFHSWMGAPDEVKFLKHPHRHMFHVRAGIPVNHNDRDREFFIEQAALIDCLNGYDMKNAGSCEMIAEYVLKAKPYVMWCEVWEDGENGARLERVQVVK